MKLISIHDGHNAAAAYMEDGEVKFAVQEERLVRIKNAGGFPNLAIQEILLKQNLSINDIDVFIFNGQKPSLYKLDNRSGVLSKYNRFFEKTKSFRGVVENLWGLVRRFVFQEADKKYFIDEGMKPLIKLGVSRDKIHFIDHHSLHAATAAYGWGINDKFAVITSDSAGDGLSGSVWIFDKGRMEKIAEISADDSIARLYSLITYYLGMVPMEHEYKLMGLAPYAEDSKNAKEIADFFYKMFEFNEDGLTYKRRSGLKPVKDWGPMLKKFLAYKRFDEISAGLQLFLERFAIEWIEKIIKNLGIGNIALSGGLFMNVKLNKKISELDRVKNLFIFPSCGDESNIFGALYLYWYQASGKLPVPLKNCYLGGDFNDDYVLRAIKNYSFKNCKINYKKLDNIEADIAKLLANKKVVARFNGRLEFGARALGNRSILANASDHNSVKIINKMIKCRDFWMPFAPSLINSSRYVVNPKNIKSPYMMLTYDIKKEKIPVMTAASHPYDNTCRPQEVLVEQNNSYYKLIQEFNKITGESVILNTSFNLHGFPIVYKPEEALYVFDNSGLEYLAISNYLVEKVFN